VSAEPQTSEFPLQPVEVFSVLAALALVTGNAVRFGLEPAFWGWPAAVLVVAGLLAADFVSGVVHWVGDTWGTDATPVLGKRLIRPFRFHHAHPLDMLKSHFFTTNGDTAMASLPFLLLPFAIPLSDGWLWVAVFVWSVGAWGMWTSQFHQWAHTTHPPRMVRVLQRSGLILSRRHHTRHHKEPFVRNYCITTGWCDPLLTRVRFFEVAEWAVTKLTGLKPRPDAE
jgi:plasmanylethanolamine desaturase